LATVLAAVGAVAAILSLGRHFVIVGLHPYRCERMQGSWPVDFAPTVSLADGLEAQPLVTVIDGHLQFVAAHVVRIVDEHEVGTGVWVAGDGVTPAETGAVDAVARRYSSMTSDVRGHSDAVAAARLCLRQHRYP